MQDRQAGLLTYGITPPKRSYSEEKRQEVAGRQSARIGKLPVDGLVIYDLQDESGRNADQRPFPYLQCIDPVQYAYDYLGDLAVPKVLYRCVAGLEANSLSESLIRIEANNGLSVLVGAASRNQSSAMRLPDAYQLRKEQFGQVPLGGVLIAERHESKRSEEARILHKMNEGCSFFITQAVYAVTASKNILSDLSYRCQTEEREIPPILITLSPCGSQKTLEFMSWLGISVPNWLRNDLLNSQDILATSVDICLNVLEDLLEFAARRGIPLGCNVESVSLRKAEIDASVELTERAAKLLGK